MFGTMFGIRCGDAAVCLLKNWNVLTSRKMFWGLFIEKQRGGKHITNMILESICMTHTGVCRSRGYCPLSSPMVRCGPLWSAVVRCGPLWSSAVRYDPLGSPVIYHHPLWSTRIVIYRQQSTQWIPLYNPLQWFTVTISSTSSRLHPANVSNVWSSVAIWCWYAKFTPPMRVTWSCVSGYMSV